MKEKAMGLIPRKDASRGRNRHTLRMVTVAVVASSALLVANDAALGVTAPARASAEVAAPLAATVPAQPPYEQLALDTLTEVVQGDFTAVSARFDEAMRQQATPDVLAQSWKSYQAEFGRYRSHGDPRQVASGDTTVVNVPLRMAKQPGEFRVAFNGDGRIVGLYFLRTGVPVP
ncbi:DUF3887 domain-containing protein [Streptomyces sp. NPDC088762]|uniref:DUF3887 domain-containing protein n=1 Tax=Streptomyces sp. NPDC088762 TaxID=3365891 RepID=UPI0037FA1D90